MDHFQHDSRTKLLSENKHNLEMHHHDSTAQLIILEEEIRKTLKESHRREVFYRNELKLNGKKIYRKLCEIKERYTNKNSSAEMKRLLKRDNQIALNSQAEITMELHDSTNRIQSINSALNYGRIFSSTMETVLDHGFGKRNMVRREMTERISKISFNLISVIGK